MGPVTHGEAGSAEALGARAPRRTPTPAGSRAQNGPLLLLALGITAAVVAWGYLVYLAIDFGTSGPRRRRRRLVDARAADDRRDRVPVRRR